MKVQPCRDDDESCIKTGPFAFISLGEVVQSFSLSVHINETYNNTYLSKVPEGYLKN